MPSLAAAQGSPDSASARALFSEGRALVAAEKYAQACPKFEESLRLDPGIGTQFNLADCWERLGRTATAWATFLDTAAAARAANQPEREQVARDRANALEGKLSRLVIQVSDTSVGLEVTRDGTPVGRASFGSATPVDPAAYSIEARAPGKKTFSARVVVANDASTATVNVPVLEDAPLAIAAPVPEKKPEKTPPPAPPPLADAGAPRAANQQRLFAYAAGGLGVIGLGVGTVAFLDYSSKNSDAKKICPQGVGCAVGDAERHSTLVDEARRSRTITDIGWSVGAAALIAGGVLYLTAPPSREQTAAWRVAPLLGSGLIGTAAEGSF